MCGIVGYVGWRQAQPVLVNALKRLEYRGYDSCGLAVSDSCLHVHKDVGRVWALEGSLSANGARAGIGHTRWATHGRVTQENAHPHLDCTSKIAVVHNGIIANFQQLRDRLARQGHTFRSETDTEVIPHLIEKHFHGDILGAVVRAVGEIKGSYAIVVLHERTNHLVVARNESPLVIGVGDGEYLVASDVPAILDYTDMVVYLEDGDIALLTPDGLFFSPNGQAQERKPEKVTWSLEEAQKGGYEHFLLKEIHQQPLVIENALKGRLRALEPRVQLEIERPAGVSSILLLACGSSFHAALIGEYLLERMTRLTPRARLASEFDPGEIPLDRTWVVGITQSGETADTLRGLKAAKRLGCPTLALTNVAGSSVTRIADQVLHLRAGPEISVCASKSFVAQLVTLYLLTLSLDQRDWCIAQRLVEQLRTLPTRVPQVLRREQQIAHWGRYLSRCENVFFIARGVNYPVALEGALKLKELAYIHAEAYAAGELKHGPLALIGPATPVVAVAPRDGSYEAVVANIKEIEAREGPVLALTEEGDTQTEGYTHGTLPVPRVIPPLSPVVNTVALQLLAYYAARERGCPVDTPRNLAKSVTVV